jgi:hypothetical protein
VTFLAVLVLRRPETLTHAEFWNEDGQVFYIGSYFGSPIDQLTRSYAGFLHAVPRVASWLERLVDVSMAPIVGNAIALIIVAGLATWIASDRLAPVLPAHSSRLILAALLVLLPGSWETLGSITLVQFYLGIFLVLSILAAAPEGGPGRAAMLGAIALSGLTGPFGILLAPVAWARAWLRRDAWSLALAGVLTACALVQAVALLLGTRVPVTPTPEGTAALILARTWSAVIGDFWLAAAIQLRPNLALVGLATTGLIGLFAIAIARTEVALRATIAWALVVTGLAALVGERATFPDSTYLASRYVLIPTFLVALLVVASSRPTRSRGPNLAWAALAGLLVFGIVGDFSLPRRATHDWAVRSACIGGPAPCDVPVEFPNAWTIHWPGLGGTYVQPAPHHLEDANP